MEVSTKEEGAVMEEIVKWMHGLPMWAQILMLVVFACKIITPLTPTQIDDVWFGKMTPMINGILKALNVGGFNVFNDKNKDDKSK